MSVSRRRFMGTTAAMSALAAAPALGSSFPATSSTEPVNQSDAPQSERTQRVMSLASRYAMQMGHWHLGTEHLMFAIVQESEQSGSQWLDELGIASEEVACIVNYIIGYGKTNGRVQPVECDLIASDNLMACLEQAGQAADELNHTKIDPEHLMLGIIDSFGTTANLLLNEMWIERGSIRHVSLASLGV